jgi:hypothetical protein
MPIQEADLYREVANFFGRVRAKMAYPVIFLVTKKGQTIRMSVAGSEARFPNSIDVTDPRQIYKGRPIWYGRIVDGEFEPSNAGSFHGETLKSTLMAFICDPVQSARDFAKLDGCCSFCGKALTHDLSQQAGYHEICAGKYDLPWGP